MRARVDIEAGTSPANQEGKPGSVQAETELAGMDREQLLAEQEKALADLDDLAELRAAFLAQSGVHIGMRVLKSARRQFEQEDARLRERIAVLNKLLHGDDRNAS